MSELPRTSLLELGGGAAVLAGRLLAATAPAVLALEFFAWLKEARWPAWAEGALGLLLGEAGRAWLAQPGSWKGLHVIAAWLADLPLSLALLWHGLALILIGHGLSALSGRPRPA